MSFRLRLRQIDDADRKLAHRALDVVMTMPRPQAMHIREVHQGELLGWESGVPARLLEEPNDLMGPSQVAIMSPDGFAYLLPILLSLGLLEPMGEFPRAVADSYARRDAAVRAVDRSDYAEVCRLLIERWKSIYRFDFGDLLPDDPASTADDMDEDEEADLVEHRRPFNKIYQDLTHLGSH